MCDNKLFVQWPEVLKVYALQKKLGKLHSSSSDVCICFSYLLYVAIHGDGFRDWLSVYFKN